MYKIVKKQMLSDSIVLMDVKADRVAKSCYPGQFVIVKMDEKGERIPLTVSFSVMHHAYVHYSRMPIYNR